MSQYPIKRFILATHDCSKDILVSIKRITIFHLLVAIERIITLSYGNIETHLIFKPHGILLKFIQYIPYSTNNKMDIKGMNNCNFLNVSFYQINIPIFTRLRMQIHR